MAQIGIDFGTTNSLIVAYDKNRNQLKYARKRTIHHNRKRNRLNIHKKHLQIPFQSD